MSLRNWFFFSRPKSQKKKTSVDQFLERLQNSVAQNCGCECKYENKGRSLTVHLPTKDILFTVTSNADL